MCQHVWSTTAPWMEPNKKLFIQINSTSTTSLIAFWKKKEKEKGLKKIIWQIFSPLFATFPGEEETLKSSRAKMEWIEIFEEYRDKVFGSDWHGQVCREKKRSGYHGVPDASFHLSWTLTSWILPLQCFTATCRAAASCRYYWWSSVWKKTNIYTAKNLL